MKNSIFIFLAPLLFSFSTLSAAQSEKSEFCKHKDIYGDTWQAMPDESLVHFIQSGSLNRLSSECQSDNIGEAEFPNLLHTIGRRLIQGEKKFLPYYDEIASYGDGAAGFYDIEESVNIMEGNPGIFVELLYHSNEAWGIFDSIDDWYLGLVDFGSDEDAAPEDCRDRLTLRNRYVALLENFRNDSHRYMINSFVIAAINRALRGACPNTSIDMKKLKPAPLELATSINPAERRRLEHTPFIRYNNTDCVHSALSATSTLKSETNRYDIKKLIDRKNYSAWVEGEVGDGIGVKFKLRSLKTCAENFQGFGFVNGYAKNKAIWEANNRVKHLRMSLYYKPFDAPVELLLNLPDTPEMVYFRYLNFDHYFYKFKLPSKIEFEILEVYKGIKYSDTAISEIEFYGYP